MLTGIQFTTDPTTGLPLLDFATASLSASPSGGFNWGNPSWVDPASYTTSSTGGGMQFVDLMPVILPAG